MKFLNIKDTEWHDCKKEMPCSSTDVDFLDYNNNIIPNGHICIEMSGAYAALKQDIGYIWDSFEKYKCWRLKSI